MTEQPVVIIGGGLAGLAAALYLARGGRTVTIFERRRYLGGRAITHLRHGYRFNLGAHALYRGGAGAAVYRELGIPVRGGENKAGGIALAGGSRHRLPLGLGSLLISGLLPAGAKAEALGLYWRIRNAKTKELAGMTAREWLDHNVTHPRLRQAVEAMMRITTFADHAETQSAAVAVEQLRIALRGVTYVDEGWQKIVDALHSAAVSAGVNFVTSSRIVRVDHDGQSVRGIELGELELDDRMDTRSLALPDLAPEGAKGTRIPASTVLLAVDPATAATLIDAPDVTASWRAAKPVVAACLDVALNKLPDPKTTFVAGIDRPIHLSVHSAFAQLTPKGGALIHVAKYRKEPVPFTGDELEPERVKRSEASAADERELETLLDELQPGWRDALVHRRFLPSMTVANALVTPDAPRATPASSIKGLYVAGDWVGDEGLLSDAALASARAAARAILADVIPSV